jgi:nitrogen fixation NifU-like protein
VKVFLEFEGGKVADASFTGEGCAISQASAALLVEYAKGKTKDEIGKISKEDLPRLLGTDLSKNPARLKCALLPLIVLKKAAQKG